MWSFSPISSAREKFHYLELHYLQPKNNENFSPEIGYTLECKTSNLLFTYLFPEFLPKNFFLHKVSCRSWECKDKYELDLAPQRAHSPMHEKDTESGNYDTM